MATNQSVRRGIEQGATSRVLEHLRQEYRDGCRVFPLMELSEATAIDPGTVESVMEQLEATGPFDVEPLDHGEIRWRLEGSANRPLDLCGIPARAGTVVLVGSTHNGTARLKPATPNRSSRHDHYPAAIASRDPRLRQLSVLPSCYEGRDNRFDRSEFTNVQDTVGWQAASE